MAKLAIAPNKEQIKNKFRGLKRSAKLKTANNKVPTIKPSCTALVICPNIWDVMPNSICKLDRTAFPANHKEVPANCENTITGSIRYGTGGEDVNCTTKLLVI